MNSSHAARRASSASFSREMSSMLRRRPSHSMRSRALIESAKEDVLHQHASQLFEAGRGEATLPETIARVCLEEVRRINRGEGDPAQLRMFDGTENLPMDADAVAELLRSPDAARLICGVYVRYHCGKGGMSRPNSRRKIM